MRGGRLLFFSTLALSLWSCSGPAARPESPAPAAAAPEPKPATGEPVYRFDAPSLKGGTAAVSAEAAPRAAEDDLLRRQKEIAERSPTDDEKLRLALLHAAAGQLEEAERVLGTLRSKAHRLVPYLEFYVRRHLGDHREAARLLERFAQEDRLASPLAIERAELCARVRRFRDYVPAESDRVRAGGTALVYAEVRNFTLKRSEDKHILHLRYEWKLFDERSAEVAVPAWDGAPAGDREDRIAYSGTVTDFYQSFALPLPAGLAPGSYRIKVTVTDLHSSRSDRVYVPIQVTTEKALK